MLMDQQWNHNLFCPRHINSNSMLKNVDHQNYLDMCPKHHMLISIVGSKWFISENNEQLFSYCSYDKVLSIIIKYFSVFGVKNFSHGDYIESESLSFFEEKNQFVSIKY